MLLGMGQGVAVLRGVVVVVVIVVIVVGGS